MVFITFMMGNHSRDFGFIEISEATLRLENDPLKLSNWFAENFMKLNEEKCNLLVFDEKDTEISQ